MGRPSRWESGASVAEKQEDVQLLFGVGCTRRALTTIPHTSIPSRNQLPWMMKSSLRSEEDWSSTRVSFLRRQAPATITEIVD